MNHWLEAEVARIRSIETPSKYALRKAKLLEQLRWLQDFALARQLELLQTQQAREQELKQQGRLSKADLPYSYITQKAFKIKIIKQLLRHPNKTVW